MVIDLASLLIALGTVTKHCSITMGLLAALAPTGAMPRAKVAATTAPMERRVKEIIAVKNLRVRCDSVGFCSRGR